MRIAWRETSRDFPGISFSLTLFDPLTRMTLTAEEVEEIVLPEFVSEPHVSGNRSIKGKGERHSRYARRDFHPEDFAIFFPRLLLLLLLLNFQHWADSL